MALPRNPLRYCFRVQRLFTDEDGATIKTGMVEHTDTQLAALFADLAELGDPAQVPVAIGRGEGLVVGLIARAGHPALMVEPARFKAARPR